MKSHVHPQRGFTLVQVLIALGLLSVIGLGLSKVFLDGVRQSNYLHSKMGATGLAQELRGALAHSKLCRQMLKDQKINRTGKTEGLRLKLPGTKGQIVKDGETLSNYGVRIRKIYMDEPVKIEDRPDGNILLKIKMLLDASPLSTESAGPEDLKTITVGTFTSELDSGGRLLDCYSLESQDDMSQKICEQSLDGTYDPSTQKCQLPDQSAKQACRLIGGKWKNGDCTLMNETECALLGGQWQSGKKRCDLNPSSEDACENIGGNWDKDAKVCAMLSEKQCLKMGGSWTASSKRCDIATDSKKTCQQLGGKWLKSESKCDFQAGGKDICQEIGGEWKDGKCLPPIKQTCKALGGKLVDADGEKICLWKQGPDAKEMCDSLGGTWKNSNGTCKFQAVDSRTPERPGCLMPPACAGGGCGECVCRNGRWTKLFDGCGGGD